jgi:hypothetical protein
MVNQNSLGEKMNDKEMNTPTKQKPILPHILIKVKEKVEARRRMEEAYAKQEVENTREDFKKLESIIL